MIRTAKQTRKVAKRNAKFRRRSYHIKQVQAWGYTWRDAIAFCVKNSWFGDKIAIGS